VRLFFALWPPPKTAHALNRWANAVMHEVGGTLTPPANIHLTLAFLGDADPARAQAAAKAVSAARHELHIDDGQYWSHNKIVWVGPRSAPAPLTDLVKQLQAALREAGFRLEERAFAPHITVLRKTSSPRALPLLPQVEWPVTEFLLVRSRSSANGSTYEPVERFPLS
jgi:RNA 2',3'-cyclic 3'-phosphodiesterase